MKPIVEGEEEDHGESPRPQNAGNTFRASLTMLNRLSTSTANSDMESKYGPDPADASTRPSVLKGKVGYIIVTEFCERVAYYGFAASLVLFFQTQLGMSNANADVQFSIWSSACYITPLIGGYVADAKLNRFRTILLFCFLYEIGLVLIVIGANPKHISAGLVFFAMYLVALGCGGIKPNVSTLGADQFDERYSRDRLEKESFFGWFYWAINLGALISYTAIAYICQYGMGPVFGGVEYGFVVGYSIPVITMGIAILVFYAGSRSYKIATPSGSILATTINICWEACYLAMSALVRREAPNPSIIHMLDRAKRNVGGSFDVAQVESVKLVTRLWPFLIAMVPYWGIYSQMSTAFQNQGCQMNLNAGALKVPVSALSMFDTIAILALVPVFDQYIYPYFKAKGYPVTMLIRIGCGFFFALLSMLVAAWVEDYRIKLTPPAGDYYDEDARNNITPCQSLDDYNPFQYQQWYIGQASQPMYCHQTCDTTYPSPAGQMLNLTCISCNDIPQMSTISVFWQIPQFVLIGISEILSSITSLEFFYSQAPTSMRSVSQAMNLATTAIGQGIIIPLIYIVNSNPNNEWITVNLNDGHLIWYFLVLAALMGVSMIYFGFISSRYEYKTTAELTSLQDRDDTMTDVDIDGDAFNKTSNNPLVNNSSDNAL